MPVPGREHRSTALMAVAASLAILAAGVTDARAATAPPKPAPSSSISPSPPARSKEPAPGEASGKSSPPASCIDLAELVPAPGDLPEGWSITRPGDTLESIPPAQGVSLVLDHLRRKSVAPSGIELFGVGTPKG